MARVHLVTGGARGIGRAIADYLVGLGDHVALLDVGCNVEGAGTDADIAASVASALGEATMAIAADVRDDDAVNAAVAAIIERWGRLDSVLNVAVVLRTGNILTATDDDWQTVLDVNVRGAIVVSRAAIRHWIATGHHGRIVNFTSTAGLEGIPELFVYSVSKAAVVGLTLATANAVASHGILVNAIAPFAATRMALRGLGDEALRTREETGDWPDIAATGLTAERVAPVASYLVSERVQVTGQVFTVGGGTTSRLGLPAPDASTGFVDGITANALAELLEAAVMAPQQPSRWQLDTLQLTRAEFPVTLLDS